MVTQSPFLFAEGIARQILTRVPPPPPWAVQEVQRRIVLLLNHVLMQEPAATGRMVRHKGSVVLFQWPPFSMCFLVTPAGLLDLAEPAAEPHLSLTLTEDSATAIAQALLRGDKPAVRIEGDVQLAAEVNWLVDHVHWDLEEDLSRIVGDASAHRLADVARRMVDGLRRFAGSRSAPGAEAPSNGAEP